MAKKVQTPQMSYDELQAAERHRMQGLRAARYGLIDEISDVITVAPQFIPSHLSVADFKSELRKFELMRNYVILIEQTDRLAKDILLVLGDSLYRQGMSYYGSVRDAAKRRAPGSQVVFNRLQQFFKRFRNKTREEPTEHQLERDVRALLHGTKEGEVIVRNEGAKVIKGNRTVIDNTHKTKGEWKETKSGEIDD